MFPDLITLQIGIEFFTNVSEAATELALISAGKDTVQNYVNDLLLNNISLSQVAMAVDSLMFGVTDNTTELTKLSTVFLPPQVAVANHYGFNPTVYAAEALGLALAGGNGTSNAFATNFGALSVAQFASEVSSLTGINSVAIQGWVTNWIAFYTANPSSTFGLSATLASYGAAFGDAVGTALVNPTASGDLALLVNEEQNALIDNAEGLYIAGIALSAEPAHTLLQGERFLIPDAGGGSLGPTIDWAAVAPAFDYGQFVAPAQTGPLTINNAPSNFTLDIQHYSISLDPTAPFDVINAAGGNGNLFTLILGGSFSDFGPLVINGYPTVNVVENGNAANNLTYLAVEAPVGSNPHLVISGRGFLTLGSLPDSPLPEGDVSIAVYSGHLSSLGTITDNGVAQLIMDGAVVASTVDASNALELIMAAPADTLDLVAGVTVLGGTQPGNILQGSLGLSVKTVTFTNGSTGLVATDFVGADNITSDSSGGDFIFGDGGRDIISLPASHSGSDTVAFGEDFLAFKNHVLAITDGSDVGYLGSWGETATATAIRNLFPGNTGGTSADVTTIDGFHAGSGGDVLEFTVAAWNGASLDTGFPIRFAAQGDLVILAGMFPVPIGAAQLSQVWVNSASNSLLTGSEGVLRYAPSDASLQSAQQLAAQLHTSSDAIVVPSGGAVVPGTNVHILVAYAAGNNVVNIADVDLVNTSASNQTSTANLNVYASDMVHLTGMSLTSLTSDNIHFI
jgi:hypothetical protein